MEITNELRQKLIKLLHEDMENNRKTEEERVCLEKEKAFAKHERLEMACVKREVKDTECKKFIAKIYLAIAIWIYQN